MRFRCISTVNMVYFECRFVFLSSLYIYFQNSTSMVNEGIWIGLAVANTPASNLRSAARAVDYLHRAFDVTPEVDATSALGDFSRMRREGQLYNSHEAFVNEFAMYAELRRVRPCWGADKHEWLRWRQSARCHRHAPFSAELGPHNAPPDARGTHYTFPTPTFIAVSVTKLKSNHILNVDIPGFNFIHNPSQTNSGGVGLYINSNLTYQPRIDLNLNNAG